MNLIRAERITLLLRGDTINEWVDVFADGENQDIQTQMKKQEVLKRLLWQSLCSSTQYYRQSLEEITSKTYSKNSFPHISNVFSNKLSTGFIDIRHSNRSVSYRDVGCQAFSLRALTKKTKMLKYRLFQCSLSNLLTQS